MNEYRARCSPPSTDSSRNGNVAPERIRRNKDTGVSTSASNIRCTGMAVCDFAYFWKVSNVIWFNQAEKTKKARISILKRAWKNVGIC